MKTGDRHEGDRHWVKVLSLAEGGDCSGRLSSSSRAAGQYLCRGSSRNRSSSSRAAGQYLGRGSSRNRSSSSRAAGQYLGTLLSKI